jgi:outer membrane receptor protein involved in Fe transport
VSRARAAGKLATTRCDAATTSRGARELPARHVVDATAHYRHARSGLSVRLSAKNAFDTTYVISRRPEGIFAGPYRQILLGLRWEWEGRTRD